MESNFFLLGQQSNSYKFIGASDICVQPSSYEGFPLCVYEEKLLKKAVVVSNIPAHSEMITNGVNGLIVDRDSESIYYGVKKLIDNPALRKALSEKPINGYITKEETIRKIENTFQ